jgi:hypothetical protein
MESGGERHDKRQYNGFFGGFGGGNQGFAKGGGHQGEKPQQVEGEAYSPAKESSMKASEDNRRGRMGEYKLINYKCFNPTKLKGNEAKEQIDSYI